MTGGFIPELREWAEAAPNDIAVRFPGHTLTTRELVARVSALVTRIRNSTIRPGELVAISAEAIDEVVGLLAVAAAGSIPVVTPSYDEFVSSGARHLVSRNREWATASAIAITDDVDELLRFAATADSPVALLTSGTTGRPKLALLTRGIIEARLDGYFDWWPTENFATMFRLSAVSGLFTMLAAIRARRAMAFISVIDRAAVEFCAEGTIRHIYGSPHQVGTLVDVANKVGQSLKFDAVSTAGAPQTTSFLNAVRRVCSGPIRSVYGSTEAGGIAISEDSTESGFTGRIGRGAEVQIVTGAGILVEPGTEGIVRYRAPGLIANYLENGSLTPASDDGWFYPGDIGRFDGNELVILRRDGDIVNVGGAKVNPLEFEALAESVDGVKDAGCAAVIFPDGSTHLVLAVVTKDEIAYKAVIAEFGNLPESNRPNVVVAVPSIPRNRNGKLMRDDLAERLTRSIRIQPGT